MNITLKLSIDGQILVVLDFRQIELKLYPQAQLNIIQCMHSICSNIRSKGNICFRPCYKMFPCLRLSSPEAGTVTSSGQTNSSSLLTSSSSGARDVASVMSCNQTDAPQLNNSLLFLKAFHYCCKIEPVRVNEGQF